MRGAGGAGPRTGRGLEPHRGVAAEGRGADRPGRRGRGSHGPLVVPEHNFHCIAIVLHPRVSGAGAGPGAGPGAGLHPGDVAREQGQLGLGLRGSGGELVVEAEGLDGEAGGPLVLTVAEHWGAAV